MASAQPARAFRGLKRLASGFPARVFAYLAVPLGGFGLVLTLLFVRGQARLLEEHLRREGSSVAALLAYEARVGVFAENPSILNEAAEGVCARSDVLEVAVFSSSRKLLLRREGAGLRPSGFRGIDARDASVALAGAPQSWLSEHDGAVVFWAPVLTRRTPVSTEDLYFAVTEEAPRQVGGLVAVMLSTKTVEESRRHLVNRSLAEGGGLLLAAALATLLAVREATKPLEDLLKQARAVAPSTADPEDDLGVLTDAFGHVVRSLGEALSRVAELTEGLERDVAERTRELVEANSELTRTRDHLEERVRDRTLALEAAHRQLLHNEKLSAVGRISASFAHEINNPVFAIRNVVESLRSLPSLDDNHRELAQAAVDECNRVAKLVRDLQGFTRPTSRGPEIVQVNQVLDSVLLLCRKEFSVHRVAVRTAYAPNLPSVWGVPDQLRQVFLNLFTNAVDAMADGGGTLTITTEAAQGEVHVKISDTGVGIAEENLGRIFDPFFTTKAEIKGVGLGLSISHQMLSAHKGSIDVDSRPGEGATFTLRLPLPEGGTA